MASKIKTQYYVDGTKKSFLRKKQGRKPSGLGKPRLVRLKEIDEVKMAKLNEFFGYYWNENEFIRDAISERLNNSVYTELLKH